MSINFYAMESVNAIICCHNWNSSLEWRTSVGNNPPLTSFSSSLCIWITHSGSSQFLLSIRRHIKYMNYDLLLFSDAYLHFCEELYVEIVLGNGKHQPSTVLKSINLILSRLRQDKSVCVMWNVFTIQWNHSCLETLLHLILYFF